VAVGCESIERAARRTYFGTKIEYELEQSGVALLAADEGLPASRAGPNGRSAKRATPILTRPGQAGDRRVVRAADAGTVLGRFLTHTEQSWSIGKPCYGYQADNIPHPVPAPVSAGERFGGG